MTLSHVSDVKILSTILSLTEALWDKISHDDHEDPDSAKEMFVQKAYFVAVTEFLVILMDRFVNSEVCKNCVNICHEWRTLG